MTMATIRAATEERVFNASKWLGLNQTGNGDTKLKSGEAAFMKNFKVTLDGNLKKRPGMKTLYQVAGEVVSSWHGFVEGKEWTFLSTADKIIYSDDLFDTAPTVFSIQSEGDHSVSQFFGFANKLYMLCMDNVYRVFQKTGESTWGISEVIGYIPVVVVNSPPAGGGTELQGVNKLSSKRRVFFSVDTPAANTVFTLPNANVDEIVSVKDRVTGNDLEFSATLVQLADGKLTIADTPTKGENTVEVTYDLGGESVGLEVSKMRFAEIYNGTTDNRVFLYGDGTNRAIYSGLTYEGEQTAAYFPDLNFVDIGDENTPITAMIRHYSRLICYKTNSAYSVQYGLVSTAEGLTIPAFYWNPVNRSIGNEAPGQVRLVDNNPLTLFQHSIYRWSNNGTYSSNLTVDERQAHRVSEKVWKTLNGFDLKTAYCYDDNEHKEWYCVNGNQALVFAYGLGDVWYYYENFPVNCMFTEDGELYGIRKNGNGASLLVHISDAYRNDCGEMIEARWESGNMAFRADYRRKYSAMMWIGLVPLWNSELLVTLRTDRKTDFSQKIVSYNASTFEHMNFAKFTFRTRRTPEMKRLKIKAKKFTYYKLVLTCENTDNPNSTAEVSSADIRVRYTGYVR